MVILLGGVPTSGKTKIVRSLIKDMVSGEELEPMKLFKCQKHNDVLVVGRYLECEQFGGTDRMSYGAIPKFRDFINQEVPKHKHIFLEGDRFFRAKDIEWLVETHDAKVFVLTVDADEEKRRHIERNDTQSETWLSRKRSQISNILTNFELMDKLEVRTNNSMQESECIQKEIGYLLHL